MKKYKRVIAVIAVFFIAGGAFYLWEWSRDLRFAKKLGAGINVGNSLDATGLRNYNPSASDLEYETFWNDEPITRELFHAISDAGFQTVRIPVTWEDHLDAEGNIAEAWMARVEEVVKYALEEDLYVIINLHHEEWLDLKTEKEGEFSQQFLQLWKQIAKRFSSYDNRLIFESMNEPRLRDSEHEWDEGTPQLREIVNRLNEIFVRTVRETGGKNKERYLMISPYATNHEEKALEALKVPGKRVIVSVHTYIPYDFCQNESGTKEWNAEEDESKEKILTVLENVDRYFLRKGIPVVFTEFGCKDKGNLEARKEWTEFFVSEAKKYGISYLWWDNGSDYALIDRKNNTWIWPELVTILTKP